MGGKAAPAAVLLLSAPGTATGQGAPTVEVVQGGEAGVRVPVQAMDPPARPAPPELRK